MKYALLHNSATATIFFLNSPSDERSLIQKGYVLVYLFSEKPNKNHWNIIFFTGLEERWARSCRRRGCVVVEGEVEGVASLSSPCTTLGAPTQVNNHHQYHDILLLGPDIVYSNNILHHFDQTKHSTHCPDFLWEYVFSFPTIFVNQFQKIKVIFSYRFTIPKYSN